MRTNALLDARALALHQAAVGKLRADPALLDRARQTLERRLKTESPNSKPYRDMWRQAMDQGLEAVVAHALDESEHGATMRRRSPLEVLLDEEQRLEIVRRFARPNNLGVAKGKFEVPDSIDARNDEVPDLFKPRQRP